MVNIMTLVCMHLIGDFYLQTTKMASCKNSFSVKEDWCNACKKKCFKNGKINWKYLLWHIVLYMVPFLFLFLWTNWLQAIITITIVGVTHAVIDILACVFRKKLKKTFVFFVDQALHIAVIVALVNLLPLELGIDDYYSMIKIFCGILMLIVPCSVAVRNLICDIYPDDKGVGILDVGSMIGIMERIMTVFFAYLGDFTAIAIIITVKTWARSDDLKGPENKDFRNKYLFGTLTSLVMALMVYVAHQKL